MTSFTVSSIVRHSAAGFAINSILSLIILTLFMPSAFAVQTLRVGVLQEAPIATSQPGGEFKGFAIDILQAVARERDWQLTFEGGSEQELLDKLERRQIDLLANLPYSEEHKDRYLFNQEFLINNWGEIATTDQSSAGSLADLNGQRIGVVQRSPYQSALRDLLTEFNIESDLIAFSSFTDVASAVARSEIDAGVLSRAFMLHKAAEFGLRGVPVIFAPLEIRYAAAGADLAGVLAAIDNFLEEGKKDSSSYYYADFDKWFPIDRSYRLPEYVPWVLIVLAALLCGFFLGRGLQRKQAQKKTLALVQTNRQLNQEVAEQDDTQRQLHQMAYYDEITSLPNRRQFNERLHETLMDENVVACVAMFDLDRFKSFNDTMGHESGNALLRLVAKRISLSLPDNVMLARYGGDEFAILIVGEPVETCESLVEKVLLGLKDPITELGNELFVTTSIGLSHYPTEASNISELLQQADIAMYRAKEEGGDMCCRYDADVGRRVIHRMEMVTNLRRALINGEMWLEYQPQVNLNTRQVLAVEALLRWRHPEWGLIDTSEFIKVAEESGQIVSIGEWVMEEVFAQATQWREAGVKPFKIAINLSSNQVQKRGFVDFVSQLIEEYDFPTETMELEMTEHVLIDHARETQKVVGKLKDLGISLAIDDFGTGYSALSYLHQFPIDTLKIDQTFVANLQHDHSSQAITGAIVAMADRLNLRTVAECVEQTEQVNILSEMQCHAAQGYYFARPLSQDKLAQWVGNVAN